MLTSEFPAPYAPVGLIVYDDRAKRHLRLHGVPVVGGRSRLIDAAVERGATTVILAITAASAELIKEASTLVEGAGLRFLVLPPVTEMVGGRVQLSDIREVDLEDILGRHQIETDLKGIASYLTDPAWPPSPVLEARSDRSWRDRCTASVPRSWSCSTGTSSALHAVQLSIYGQGLLDTPDIVLADIRDEHALDPVFEAHHPDVVLHAAAMKHLPMLEQYPEEGWKDKRRGKR